MFGHSASQGIDDDDDDDDDGRGRRRRTRATTTTGVRPARECDIVDNTHRGITTTTTTTVTVTVTHATVDGEGEFKARVGRLKRTNDHTTGGVDDERG